MSEEFHDKFSHELLPGSTVDSEESVYVLVKLKKESPRSAVYIVRDVVNSTRQFTMKLERRSKSIDDSDLKRESLLLKRLAQKTGVSHFPALIDRGKKETFNFIVVELVGKTLAELKKLSLPNKVFSIGTGIEVGGQCLEAINQLHAAGFVHRDIKPGNFAAAVSGHRIYMIDFGLTRKFLNARGEAMEPRRQVDYRGTIRFAPLCAHRSEDISPKDDCESWFYMLIDLISPTGLPWKGSSNAKEIGDMKKECRSSRQELLVGIPCPKEFSQILDYVDGLSFHQRIDYGYIEQRLLAAARTSKVQLGARFDWEQIIEEVETQASTPTTARAAVPRNSPTGLKRSSRTRTSTTPSPSHTHTHTRPH